MFGYSVRDVHAQEGRDERRHHEHHRDDGEPVDDMVQVVRDDAPVGVHRAIEDVGVHVRHRECLRVVNDDVLKQIGQVFIAVDVQKIRSFHFHFQQLIGIERIDKIDQTLLNGEQALQVRIAAAVHQVFFEAIAPKVERFEAAEEVIHVLLQHLQHKALFVGGLKVADIVFQELRQHDILYGRDREDVLNGEYDADRHSDEVCFAFLLRVFVFDRRVEEDKTNVLIAFVASALVQIERVGEKRRVKLETTGNVVQFVRGEGWGEVHPAARLRLGQLDQASFFACIVAGHCP